MQEIKTENVKLTKLDKDLSEFSSLGPIFEGMPAVKFSEDDLTRWDVLSKQIFWHFAPSLPFRYLKE